MQGQTQGELNEKGREQARQVAERLASEQIDAVIASDLHRAVQTAEYIAQPHHLEVHREYKNVQKSVLTNVNIQRTGKTSLLMFVYFIFDGSFICRFLYIFRPSSVPRHSICPI